MPIQYAIRSLQTDDLLFLHKTIFLAANWRMSHLDPVPPALKDGEFLARYVSGWGRLGDAAFVAEGPAGLIGTASYRLFTSAESSPSLGYVERDQPAAGGRGYGFVDERTPEISLAVLHAYRRNGIGTALLKALLKQASTDGYTQVSVSVNKENPALNLCRKFGFTTVATQPNSLMMVCHLNEF